MAQTKLSKHWEKANQQVQVEHSHFKDTGREIQVAFRKAFVPLKSDFRTNVLPDWLF